ncbi:MAG TPA: MopE-related protein [Candidatus Polarisedimenticolia bacterium]|nr:MopE-related protein [Candidatus Polarisedimenticolia bacterium]
MVRACARRTLLVAGLVGAVLLPAATARANSPLLARFGIVTTEYRDLDGDLDPFPDPGESGRLALTLRNGPDNYTGAALVLISSDPDVACIPGWRLDIGDLAPGQTVEVGSLAQGAAAFAFKAAATIASASGANPARLDFCVRLKADQIVEVTPPVCFFLQADLDLPGGAAQAFIPGPDGVPGTADDGTLFENFDVDRDGDGLFTVNDTFRMTDAGSGQIVHGSYLRGSGTQGAGLLGAVTCGGFYEPYQLDACALDPDYPMDWHLHCPPGAGNCPNVESGPCSDGVAGAPCTRATPADGAKSLSLPNSMHMGLHFTGRDSLWDTTHHRTLQAFVSAPVNLAVAPRAGDLQMSMFQIAALMDNNTANLYSHGGNCADCADVQIQVDRDLAPALDNWGAWDKLAPFQNLYDHTPSSWSFYGSYYCLFTPTDAGTAPPAPRGLHETLCFGQGAWSTCGTPRGNVFAGGPDCAGPSAVDPTGNGVWVETRFDLSAYRGQRVRIRWIGSSWTPDPTNPHYGTWSSTWNTMPTDDGWWIDDVKVTGVLAGQTTPVVDTHPAVGSLCPDFCTDIDEDDFGSPASVVCAGGSQIDCNDLRSDIYPGAPEGCNRIDNDCDGQLSIEERDADGDGEPICEGDCDDHDYWTYQRAEEQNDGKSNDCPPHLGACCVDEISYPIYFASPTALHAGYQYLSTSRQVVRSTRVDFSSDCAVYDLPGTYDVALPDAPPPGVIWYYQARVTAPHLGSWGPNSAGVERTVPCVP